jgi:hypothetical protein
MATMVAKSRQSKSSSLAQQASAVRRTVLRELEPLKEAVLAYNFRAELRSEPKKKSSFNVTSKKIKKKS